MDAQVESRRCGAGKGNAAPSKRVDGEAQGPRDLAHIYTYMMVEACGAPGFEER